MNQDDSMMDQKMTGGRRARGSKKRRGNSSLRAWVTFVKKVQKEENISYKEAMMRAKKRKDSGEKWRGGGSDADLVADVADYDAAVADDVAEDANLNADIDDMAGGRRRRRTRKHRGSKKRRNGRKSRKHR